jgi:hypothetical protein
MSRNRPNTRLERFFLGIAEYVFQSELGIADPPLVDYVGDLVCRCLRIDALYRIRTADGRPISQVADLLAEAQRRRGVARREVHRHIGDFTLFWSGFYPEMLRKLRRSSRRDSLIDYPAQGKRAYLMASTIHPTREDQPPSDVLQRLSHHFELCAEGLREVRRQCEAEAADGLPGPLVID